MTEMEDLAKTLNVYEDEVANLAYTLDAADLQHNSKLCVLRNRIVANLERTERLMKKMHRQLSV